MKLSTTMFVLLFCLSVASQTHSEQFRLSKSPLNSLIDQKSITSIHRDSRGYLWVGSQEGLYRFDGANLTAFNSHRTNKHWIPTSEVIDIGEDAEGILYIATFGQGLLKWSRNSNSFEPVPQFNSSNDATVEDLHVTKSGKIWLRTQDQIVLIDPVHGTNHDWIQAQYNTSALGRPSAMLETAEGNLIVATGIGLIEISPGEKSIRRLNILEPGPNERFDISVLHFDGLERLFVGTTQGKITLVDMSTKEVLAEILLDVSTPRKVTDILSHNERILIATDNGAYLSDRTLTNVRELRANKTNQSIGFVSALVADGENVWIGTFGGLNILSSTPFEFFGSNTSSMSNEIWAVEEDAEGNIWIGTYDGLYVLDEATPSVSTYIKSSRSTEIIDPRIQVITTVGTTLWVGYAFDGVQVIDLASSESHFPKFLEFGELMVTDIQSSNDGQDIWVSSYNHGLFRITDSDTVSFYDNTLLSEKVTTGIFNRNDGSIIVSALRRLYGYDLNSNTFQLIDLDFDLDDELPIFYSFNESQGGDLWIGTQDHGLFRWPHEYRESSLFEVQAVGLQGGLENSAIYDIVFDADRNIWCSTSNGLVKLDPLGNFVTRFTKSDGLQGNDFNLGASLVSRDGHIYFGGPNGVNRFDPRKVEVDRSPSPMSLTNIRFPGQEDRSVPTTAGLRLLELSHKDRFVTFEFSVMDFIELNKNQFRYMLENFDTDWIDNGTHNTATYTNLPPGDYVFRVEGANSAGIWNREGLTLDVRVSPPPWATWWAYCLYALTFMLAMWGLNRIYQSYAINRKAKQMAQSMRDAEDRADEDLQEQMEFQQELVQAAYHHNISTLSLVRGFFKTEDANQPDNLNRMNSEGAGKRLAALSILEDSLYYQPGGPVANLHQYTDMVLEHLLATSPVNSETVISINEVPTQLLPVAVTSPLSVIIYELLENCLEHAFEAHSPVNYIQISLETTYTKSPSHYQYQLTIRDDGIGIPENYQENINESSGITIIQAIASELDGTVIISAEKGTSVSVTVFGPEPS